MNTEAQEGGGRPKNCCACGADLSEEGHELNRYHGVPVITCPHLPPGSGPWLLNADEVWPIR